MTDRGVSFLTDWQKGELVTYLGYLVGERNTECGLTVVKYSVGPYNCQSLLTVLIRIKTEFKS